MVKRTGKKNSLAILKVLLCLLTVTLLSVPRLVAQPIPIGGLRDDQVRTLQILSDSTISSSLLNRPIGYSTYQSTFNPSNYNHNSWWGYNYKPAHMSYSLHGYDLHVGAYEPVLTNTINSGLPYGENNGAAWYGKGLNSELQGGFYVNSKYFSVTFRPHFIYTENRSFLPPQRVPHYPNGDIRYVADGRLPEYRVGNRIDRPWRFGPDSYGTFDLGQTSVRLHYKKLEAGVSKSNLWWGPGVRYSLIMSNNAAGLRHVFLGTRKPIAIPGNIGDIEFRWILGWPKDSQYFDLYDLNKYGDRRGKKPREEILSKTRFLNGINIVYTPSFLPNLSVGIARVVEQYVPDGGLSFTHDILDVFQPFQKPDQNKVLNDYRDVSHFETKDPVSSVFFRWVFPGSDAEFYGEYYKGDHNRNLRDFLTEPQHGRAYTLGVQKLLEFDGPIDFFKVNAEINTLLEGPIDELRPQTDLYTHSTIRQGYTNRGQVMGAAIGPGSSSQYIGVDGYFKHGKIGIFGQREVIDNHYFYEVQDRYFKLGGFKDQIHHRINLNVGLRAKYQIGSFLLGGKFTFNRNFNYGRYAPSHPEFYTFPVPIIDNFQYQLSIRYLF